MLAELIIAAEETPNPLLPAWYDIVYSLIPFILVLLLFWRVVLPRMQKTLDERAALAQARDRLYALWRTEPARSEADRIQERHGSRKSATAATAAKRKTAASKARPIRAANWSAKSWSILIDESWSSSHDTETNPDEMV